ncbi:MAG: alpha/beta hydrolase [bacterium]|nr:alpha/beta hydrolase [bacterium]
MRPTETVIYKTVEGDSSDPIDLTMDIFKPLSHRSTDRRPVMVFFFGGGWNGGTQSQFHPHCHYFSSRGLIAISAEYRVKSRHGTEPSVCVQDGKSAIRWIRNHAEDLGIDGQKVIAAGGSAGGHVAAATATVKKFNEPEEDLATDCKPQALVLFNPVFDNSPEGYGYDRVQAYWRDFSPMHNIDETPPPTVVFLGTEDKLIPTATAEAYQKRMADSGCRCDVHLYEGQGHGFFNFGNYDHYVKTVVETDTFLASLGYVTGEPTLFPEPKFL